MVYLKDWGVTMITKIYNGKLIIDNEIVEKDLYFENNVITEITNKNQYFDIGIDAGGCYVSPGFVDIHNHGGGGFEYVDATKEAIVKASNIHAIHGSTTIFPSLAAHNFTEMEKALNAFRKFKDEEEIIPNLPGIHLEGPYFSPAQCGGQDADQLRNPNPKEYMDLIEHYGNIIKRWSYAPELDKNLEFLNALSTNDIIPSAGHTDAKFEDIKIAYDNGCKLITHLYSCTSTITREYGFRKLGVIETAYLYDDIYVEAIADGCHLPPELLKLIYKLKGSDHMCLVTDSIRFGAMTDVSIDTAKNNHSYIIEDGVAKLPDRSAFAGSIATSDVLVRTCVKKTDIPLTEVIKMVTLVPCNIMKLQNKGLLKSGYDADIVIFDNDITIKKVIVNGKAYNI